MRRLEYFTVCRSVSMDSMSGELSLFHVTHHLVLTAPTIIPSLSVVAAWIDDEAAPTRNSTQQGESTESHVKLNVISPGGEQVNTFRRTLNSPNRVEQSVFRVMNIPIPAAGDLIFELLVDDEHTAKHTVSIREKTP